MKRFSLIMLLVLSSGLLLTSCDETADQTPLLGRWDGFMTAMGIDIGFAIEFSEGDDGLTALMDSSSQGAYGLPVEAITLDDEAVSFELPTPNGRAYYEGTLEGSTITGTFTQNGYTDVFTLKLYNPADYPYTQEEVTIEAADGFPLRGTLTLPEGEGPHPALILITGSGPQDRDEEIFGFEPFRVIADHLSREGFAVLRCDDRTLGQPLEMFNNITTAELANDIIDQLAYLRGRDEIDAIGLFGHSEGAIVSMMIAAEDAEVAFIMFMGGQGLTGEEVMVEQLVAIMELEGSSEESIAAAAAFQRKIFNTVKRDGDLSALKGEGSMLLLNELMALPEEERAQLGDISAYIEARIDGQLAMAEGEWIRFYLAYDPAADLARLTCPVLALLGEFDAQVVAESNGAALEAALSAAEHPDYSIRIVAGANHLFQPTESGAFSEYATLPKEFVPGFLDTITDWLHERFKM